MSSIDRPEGRGSFSEIDTKIEKTATIPLYSNGGGRTPKQKPEAETTQNRPFPASAKKLMAVEGHRNDS